MVLCALNLVAKWFIQPPYEPPMSQLMKCWNIGRWAFGVAVVDCRQEVTSVQCYILLLLTWRSTAAVILVTGETLINSNWDAKRPRHCQLRARSGDCRGGRLTTHTASRDANPWWTELSVSCHRHGCQASAMGGQVMEHAKQCDYICTYKRRSPVWMVGDCVQYVAAVVCGRSMGTYRCTGTMHPYSGWKVKNMACRYELMSTTTNWKRQQQNHETAGSGQM